MGSFLKSLATVALALLILIPWGLSRARAFPLVFPKAGQSEPRFLREFKIGTIVFEAAELEIGDEIVFTFTLPVSTGRNVNFLTDNRGMPDYLDASNEGTLAFPVQNYNVDSAIIYKVKSLPKGTGKVSFEVWASLDSEDFSLGQGLSRVSLVKCAGGE